MRKAVSFLLSVCIVLTVFLPSFTANAAYELPEGMTVFSDSVLLMDMDTGKVIYSKNANKEQFPASLTKIMTCLIVLESIPDDQLDTTMVTAPIAVFDELYLLGASNAGIMAGEVVSVTDLLYALMLPSACEAAGILANHIGQGDSYTERTADFVRRMNEKAKELGCSDKTNFANAHGLHDDSQKTTAADLWKILDYTIKKYPRFLTISNAKSYSMHATNKHEKERTIYHTNKMLRAAQGSIYYSPHILGIKTGTTSQSGLNLVSMAKNDGYSYLLITMHAPTKYESGEPITDNYSYLDHKNLYKWVFDSFSLKTIVKSGSSVSQVKIKLGKDKDTLLLAPKEDVISLLPSDVDISSVQKVPNIPKEVSAPVKKGQQIGSLDLKLNDEVIATVSLVAYEDIERSTFLAVMDWVKNFFTSPAFLIAVIIIILFLAVYITLIVRYNNKKKRMHRVYRNRRL